MGVLPIAQGHSISRIIQAMDIVVAITGASGAPYARRLVAVLRGRADVELGVCVSPTAAEVWALECGGDLREAIGVPVWSVRDYKAPFASGSAGWSGRLASAVGHTHKTCGLRLALSAMPKSLHSSPIGAGEP